MYGAGLSTRWGFEMRCADVELLLSDYADGVADARGRRIVERHMQLCRSCREGAMIARQLGQQLLRISLLPLGIGDRVPRLRRRLEQKLARKRRLEHIAAMVARALLVILTGVLGLLLLLLLLSS